MPPPPKEIFGILDILRLAPLHAVSASMMIYALVWHFNQNTDDFISTSSLIAYTNLFLEVTMPLPPHPRIRITCLLQDVTALANGTPVNILCCIAFCCCVCLLCIERVTEWMNFEPWSYTRTAVQDSEPEDDTMDDLLSLARCSESPRYYCTLMTFFAMLIEADRFRRPCVGGSFSIRTTAFSSPRATRI